MIVDCAHYQAGIRQEERMSLGEAGRLAREGPGFVWLASSEPGPEELDELGASFDLPPRAVEDARDGHQRPKLDQYGEGVYLVVKTLRYDEVTTQTEIGEFDVFVGARYAIVISRSTGGSLASARERLDEHPRLARLGPMAAAWPCSTW